MGVNTAQTNYNLNIERSIFYTDRSTSAPLFQYHHNISPTVLMMNSTTEDPTSYKFYSSNLTLYVENFSVPSPQDVRGVKFTCEFNVVNQGRRIHAETTTSVIPGFCKFIICYILEPNLLLSLTNWAIFSPFWSAHDIDYLSISTLDPPKITRRLDNVTVIPQGSSHTFMVQVYSHPSSRVYWWQLNGTKLLASNPHFIMNGPHISGNTSNFNLTILNTKYVHCACIDFVAHISPAEAACYGV